VKQKVIELNDVKCILGKTNVGLYENHLIDTAVVDVPLDLKTILITHGHADHFAWAKYAVHRASEALGALVAVRIVCGVHAAEPKTASSVYPVLKRHSQRSHSTHLLSGSS